MGCDIHATLEVYDHGSWICINEHLELNRNYDAFGVFFGVRGTLATQAIAGYRDIPHDASPATRALFDDFGEDAHSASYLYPEDLQKIRDLPAVRDNRIHVYQRVNDTWVYTYKASVISSLPGEFYFAPGGTTIEQGDTRYCIEMVEPLATFDTTWQGMLHMLTYLGIHFGQRDVRLVVWFDN